MGLQPVGADGGGSRGEAGVKEHRGGSRTGQGDLRATLRPDGVQPSQWGGRVVASPSLRGSGHALGPAERAHGGAWPASSGCNGRGHWRMEAAG